MGVADLLVVPIRPTRPYLDALANIGEVVTEAQRSTADQNSIY